MSQIMSHLPVLVILSASMRNYVALSPDKSFQLQTGENGL